VLRSLRASRSVEQTRPRTLRPVAASHGSGMKDGVQLQRPVVPLRFSERHLIW
jgi:hypothetical protein